MPKNENLEAVYPCEIRTLRVSDRDARFPGMAHPSHPPVARPDAETSRSGSAPPAAWRRAVTPETSSITPENQCPTRSRTHRSRRCFGWFNRASASASCANLCRVARSVSARGGKNLAQVTLQLLVVGAIYPRPYHTGANFFRARGSARAVFGDHEARESSFFGMVSRAMTPRSKPLQLRGEAA